MKKVIIGLLILFGIGLFFNYAEEKKEEVKSFKIDVGDNTFKMLTDLAQKMGTTVERLYPSYMVRIQVKAKTDLWLLKNVSILTVIIFVLGFVLLGFGVDRSDAMEAFGGVFLGLSLLLLLIVLIWAGSSLADLKAQTVSPESYVVKEMMSDLKGS